MLSATLVIARPDRMLLTTLAIARPDRMLSVECADLVLVLDRTPLIAIVLDADMARQTLAVACLDR